MFTHHPRCVLAGMLVACWGLAACATVRFSEDLVDYRQEVARYEQSLKRNPDNLSALSRLGVIYVRTGYPVEAQAYLERAYALDSTSAQVLFYLGAAYEANGALQQALPLYARYEEVPRGSPYHRMLSGRYQWVLREIAREEIRALVAAEQEIGADPPPANRLAVFSFTAVGGDPNYAVLGRGLAEMMTTDLSNVEQIEVVERVRLQALLDELKLAESGVIDPTTAPRSGRLLGAGRLVGGSYAVGDEEDLRLDAALLDVTTAAAPQVDTREGTLAGLFRLEKEVVYHVLGEMDVTPTDAERARIEYIPTENLQAFLAFCRGLIDEDQGSYEQAEAHFQEAVALDAGFVEATTKLNRLREVLDVVAQPETDVFLSSLGSALPEDTFVINLVDERLQHLNTQIGTNTDTGEEERKPESEATSLPNPSPPPGGN